MFIYSKDNMTCVRCSDVIGMRIYLTDIDNGPPFGLLVSSTPDFNHVFGEFDTAEEAVQYRDKLLAEIRQCKVQDILKNHRVENITEVRDEPDEDKCIISVHLVDIVDAGGLADWLIDLWDPQYYTSITSSISKIHIATKHRDKVMEYLAKSPAVAELHILGEDDKC